MSTTRFGSWLQFQLDKNGWTQAELARRSKLTTAGISRMMTGSRGIGLDGAHAIATALKIPMDEVVRVAIDLPPKPKDQADLDDLVYKYGLLDGNQKAQALDFLEFLLERGETAPVIELEVQPIQRKPMTEDELVNSIRLLALSHGYRLEDLDLPSILKAFRKAGESQSSQAGH